MAKKFHKKAVKKRDNQKLLLIGVFIVGGSMLFSGLYYFSSDETQQRGGNEEQPEPWVDTYQIKQIGNFSIITRISSVTQDFIVMPESRCVYFAAISEIQNISAGRNIRVSSEVSQPTRFLDPAPMICGFYIIFKFSSDTGNNNSFDADLETELRNKLGKFSVLRGYMADLPVNISGTDKVYVVGQQGNNVGDYIRIVLYQKTSNDFGSGMIGFEERRIPIGPVVPATVVNVTGIVAQGKFEDELPSDLQERLNATTFNVFNPRILINQTLENETAERLKNITGVIISVIPEENRSEISFNKSRTEVISVLEREGIKYSLEMGEILFRTSLDSDTNYLLYILTESRITDVRFGKEGAVSIPQEVIIDNKLVAIRDNNEFGAILEMERKTGDRINVSINTARFGEQIIAFGASEVAGKQEAFQ